MLPLSLPPAGPGHSYPGFSPWTRGCQISIWEKCFCSLADSRHQATHHCLGFPASWKKDKDSRVSSFVCFLEPQSVKTPKTVYSWSFRENKSDTLVVVLNSCQNNVEMWTPTLPYRPNQSLLLHTIQAASNCRNDSVSSTLGHQRDINTNTTSLALHRVNNRLCV